MKAGDVYAVISAQVALARLARRDRIYLVSSAILAADEMATTCAGSTALAATQPVLTTSQAEEEVREGLLSLCMG